MTRKKIIITILALAAIWICAFSADYVTVTKFEHEPLFCIETKGHHYVGAGYSYDVYDHPVTGQSEYAFYIFGHMVKSTFTD